MPYTVDVSFDKYFETINLAGDHRETANTRRDNIVEKLSKYFTINDAFSAGSIPKFTALKGYADLDVIVVLHYSKHIQNRTPTQVLQSVRKALSQWKTGARKNGQAVTLYYTTWPNVDVVPVSMTPKPDGSVAYYNVPDSNTETWIQSRPKEHAAAIEAKASECGYNFRRIIKMAKDWNRTHGSYLQSYHLEVLALNAFSGNIDDTPWNIRRFFEIARMLISAPLFYDTGYVDAYLGYNDRAEALKRVSSAYDLALSAWHNGSINKQQLAIEKWRQLFGDRFPAYG